jgi:glycosyltransferase involved in cell wall biosynthesis
VTHVSIVLCTWNGAAFIEEQLASLSGQTRPPDELVVCDDASTDETAAIIKRFKPRAGFPVYLIQNTHRMGTVKNYEQAIGTSKGDVILLCDQDDVWNREKVATLLREFDRDKDLALLFTNALQIAENGAPLPRSLWDHIGFTQRERRLVRSGRAFEVLVDHNVVTGATIAFRSRWRSSVLPIPDDAEMLHDQWIALILSATAQVSCLDARLIDYRQHAAQQVGAGAGAGGVRRWVGAARNTSAETYARHAYQLEAALHRLETLGTYQVRLDQLRDRIAHLRTRASLPRHRWSRVPAVMRELTSRRYHRYSNHFWSAAKDLFW